MQGKTRRYLEDVGLILVVGAMIYGGYSYFFNSENKIELSKMIIVEKFESFFTTTPFDNKEEISVVVPKNDITESDNEEIQTIEINIPVVDEKVISLPEDKAIIEEETIIEEEISEFTSNKREKEKKKILRDFLRDTKYTIASNIIKKDDVDSLSPQELKIRITILKDGFYEQLRFIDGDEDLFEMNKENILKVFPVVIDENIKENFPRYLRMSIK